LRQDFFQNPFLDGDSLADSLGGLMHHLRHRTHRHPAGLPLNEQEDEILLPPELPEVLAYKE
jgi:hypothetical protein